MQPQERPHENADGMLDTMRLGGASGVVAGKSDLGVPEGYDPEIAETTGEEAGEPYVVKAGDTLQSIAQQFYGDSDEWERIYQANEATLVEPERLVPGQELQIPPQ